MTGQLGAAPATPEVAAEPSTPARRPRVMVLAYSDVSRDARVLRQIEYLSETFDVIVAGHGAPVVRHGVRWVELPRTRSLPRRLAGHFLLVVGRVWPGAYRLWFRLRPSHVAAASLARRERCDIYLANDWHTLPAAASGAAQHGTKLVLDAHEYSPLEWESSRAWMLLYRPLVIRVLRDFATRCDASITVCAPIAARFSAELPLAPTVVLNAPRAHALRPQPAGSNNARVRLIHHGSAIRERRLELMIEAIALAGDRFDLTFMLIGDPGYISELRSRAEERAPGRVTFVDPVPPSEIVPMLAAYDMGIFILETRIYNYAMALPNKLFDFIAAGLGVVIGPSPAMAQFGTRYGFVHVAPDFTPRAVAQAPDSLQPDDIAAMKAAARRAGQELNADAEMPKLVALLTGLLQPSSR